MTNLHQKQAFQMYTLFLETVLRDQIVQVTRASGLREWHLPRALLPSTVEELGAVKEPTVAQGSRQTAHDVLEFYFSDTSFPFDEFLASQADAEGSIAASVLANSPRVITLTPALDLEARTALLLSVAQQSDSVVIVGETRFKRRYPLPAEDPAAPRSVHRSWAEQCRRGIFLRLTARSSRSTTTGT